MVSTVLYRPFASVSLARILLGPRYRVGYKDLALVAGWASAQNRAHRDELDDERSAFLLAEALEHLDEIEGLSSDGRARLEEFAEEHELSDGEISLLLLDIAVKSRMADYMLSVEKPSGAGLKLELDRMRHEAEQLIRSAKKVADGYVAHTKEVLKQAEGAEQDEQKS